MRTKLSRRAVLGTPVLLAGAVPGAAADEEMHAAEEMAAALPLEGAKRARRALQIRRTCALLHADQPEPHNQSNGDEARIPRYAAMFTKTLPHNELAEVEPRAYAALLQSMASGSMTELAAVPGGPGKLVNPLSSLAYALEGMDGHKVPCAPPPAFDSAEQAAEMVELYWMALARDVPFREYGTSPLVEAAAKELGGLTALRTPRVNGAMSGAILPEQIFRQGLEGEIKGPYVSQLLWMDVPFGSQPMPQRYTALAAGKEYMTEYGEFLAQQRGAAPSETAVRETTARYIRNGRDMATYVWKDFSYQAFLLAGLVLLGQGPRALAATNPYKAHARSAGFATFGGPMILDLVARAANAALQGCWYQKWSVHRKLRPEVFAARLLHQMEGRMDYQIHASLPQSRAVAETKQKFGTVLLPQAYPEGAPAHPSFAAGHAAVAGACVTMLKALFDEEFVLASPVEASADGLTLEPYVGAPLTVGGELNKLAVNCGYGRHFAGIHYRADARESLVFGETVAIAILKDVVRTMAEVYPGFELRKFDGTRVFVAS